MPARTVEVAIAERRHRVKLENPGTPVPDPDGGFIEGWTLVADAWATVTPASQRDLEDVIAGTVTATAPFLVVMRWVAGVSTHTRITYHGRVFAVIGVRDVDERHVRLEIVCEERTP